MIIDQRTSENTGASWEKASVSDSLVEEISAVTPAERASRYGQKPTTILFTVCLELGNLPRPLESSVNYSTWAEARWSSMVKICELV